MLDACVRNIWETKDDLERAGQAQKKALFGLIGSVQCYKELSLALAAITTHLAENISCCKLAA